MDSFDGTWEVLDAYDSAVRRRGRRANEATTYRWRQHSDHAPSSDGALSACNSDDERSDGEYQHPDRDQYQRCVHAGNEILEEEHGTDQEQSRTHPESPCLSQHPVSTSVGMSIKRAADGLSAEG